MEYGSGPSLEPPYIMRISCLGRDEIEFGFCVMPSAANLHSRLQHCSTADQGDILHGMVLI